MSSDNQQSKQTTTSTEFASSDKCVLLTNLPAELNNYSN